MAVRRDCFIKLRWRIRIWSGVSETIATSSFSSHKRSPESTVRSTKNHTHKPINTAKRMDHIIIRFLCEKNFITPPIVSTFYEMQNDYSPFFEEAWSSSREGFMKSSLRIFPGLGSETSVASKTHSLTIFPSKITGLLSIMFSFACVHASSRHVSVTCHSRPSGACPWILSPSICITRSGRTPSSGRGIIRANHSRISR